MKKRLKQPKKLKKASICIVAMVMIILAETIALAFAIAPKPTSTDFTERTLQLSPNWMNLRKALFKIDINSNVLLSYSPFFEEIANNGHLYKNEVEYVQFGEPHRCRENAGDYFFFHPDECLIAIGYVFSGKTREWSIHTWIVQNDGVLLEVTFPKQNYTVSYYGATLSKQQSVDYSLMYGQYEL